VRFREAAEFSHLLFDCAMKRIFPCCSPRELLSGPKSNGANNGWITSLMK
jgi:hypothetical protein